MKILLNILTHGDERIGLKVAKELQKLPLSKGALTVHVANKKAFNARKRFIDQDLNRSFPGKKYGNHEERLAYRISPLVKSADVVLDIHSTTSELRDALIVTNLTPATRKCIEAIGPKYTLIMNATRNNALISQAKIGLAFEYGNDDDPRVLKNIVADIQRLFFHVGVSGKRLPIKKISTTYFTVTAEVHKPKGYVLTRGIKNYKKICKGEIFATAAAGKRLIADEEFYPILFGEKNYKHIFGFKGMKMV